MGSSFLLLQFLGPAQTHMPLITDTGTEIKETAVDADYRSKGFLSEALHRIAALQNAGSLKKYM